MPSQRSKTTDIPKQILEQATKLFAARGFVGASLRDIAKAVGIRKPSLLYHFPSKDDLRQGVLEQMLAHWNEVVPKILQAATSGPEQFDGIARETMAFFAADPDRARLLLRELLDRPDEMAPLVERHIQPWARIVCDYIRKGQQRGRVHADLDPEAYVVNTINLVLCGVAIHGCVGSLLPAPQGASAPDVMSRRLVDEMMRVAKSSLFIPSAEHTEG
jgi:AcrR family transcriptional regulator